MRHQQFDDEFERTRLSCCLMRRSKGGGGGPARCLVYLARVAFWTFTEELPLLRIINAWPGVAPACAVSEKL